MLDRHMRQLRPTRCGMHTTAIPNREVYPTTVSVITPTATHPARRVRPQRRVSGTGTARRWWQVGTEQVRPDDGASISHMRLADTLQPPDRAHRTGRRMSAFGGVFDPLRHAAHHEPRMTSFGARVRWQRKPRPGRVNKSAAARRHRLEKCHPETRGSTDCDPLALRGQDDFSNPPSWTMSNTRRSRSDAPTTVIFASLLAS